MNVIYSDKPIPEVIGLQSMFLAGPTPRDMITPSWRPQALGILKELKYTGTVLVPEHEVRKQNADYDLQVEWEDEGFRRVTRIVFWIPRDLGVLPAFTTNVEFGRFHAMVNCLYGRPDGAPKTKYLDWLYCKYNIHPIYNDLQIMLKNAIL